MSNVQCAVCSVQCKLCKLCRVECAVFSRQCAGCGMQSRLCTVQYAVCSVECAVYRAECMVCSIECVCSDAVLWVYVTLAAITAGTNIRQPDCLIEGHVCAVQSTVVKCCALHYTTVHYTGLHWTALDCIISCVTRDWSLWQCVTLGNGRRRLPSHE